MESKPKLPELNTKPDQNRPARAQRPRTASALVPVNPDEAAPENVKDAVRRTLTTQTPNALAMTFTETDKETGETRVSPYVRKAGRSMALADIAKTKGGLIALQPIQVRSSFEDPKVLLALYQALDVDARRDFMQSRGNDFRCLTSPAGVAVYRFRVLFRNGEVWEGEGLAHPQNINFMQADRKDEIAETRAFMRAVGRGMADGFMDPKMLAMSDAEIDDAAANLIDMEGNVEAEVMEADPGGSSFRPSDRPGAGVAGRRDHGPNGHETAHGMAPPGEEGPGEPPADAGVGWSAGEVRRDGTPASRPTPSVNDLLALARARGANLIAMAAQHYGRQTLGALTDAERLALEVELAGGGPEHEVATGD